MGSVSIIFANGTRQGPWPPAEDSCAFLPPQDGLSGRCIYFQGLGKGHRVRVWGWPQPPLQRRCWCGYLVLQANLQRVVQETVPKPSRAGGQVGGTSQLLREMHGISMPSAAVDRSEEDITLLGSLASEPSSGWGQCCTCFLQAAAKGFHQRIRELEQERPGSAFDVQLLKPTSHRWQSMGMGRHGPANPGCCQRSSAAVHTAQGTC